MKVLHIGNIANNGYLNSRIMRRAGIESDNWSIDYYHFMGYPEWEEGRLSKPLDVDIKPDWTSFGYVGPTRPQWFLIGSHSLVFSKSRKQNRDAARKLLPETHRTKLSVNIERARELIDDLVDSTNSLFKSSALGKAAYLTRYAIINGHDESINAIVHMPRSSLKKLLVTIILRASAYINRWIKHSTSACTEREESALSPFDLRVRELCSLSHQLESGSELVLRPSDLEQFRHIFPELERAIAPYDIVVGYAYDGILALLAKKKYIAFEHGTIRNLPFENTVAGRVCRVVYKLANKVFITNCDNNVAAAKLRLHNYQFIPHPINEDISELDRAEASSIRAEWNKRFGDAFIIFSPPRHHWSDQRHTDWDKGNDRLITAIAEAKKNSSIKIVLVTVELGRDVEKSKSLIKQLDLEPNVIWITPVPHHQLVSYMLASDVVADQFNVPSFGGIPPKALMVGKPVLTSFEPQMHGWCFRSLPPFQATDSSSESIASALLKLLNNPGELKQLGEAGINWYAANYSNALILELFRAAFDDLLQSEKLD